MKMTRGLAARVSAVAVGGLLLAGGAGAAMAEEIGDDDIEVNVEIAPLAEGALTLTVGGTSETLEEVASGVPTLREFRGSLPTVTVTDTRSVEQIQEGLDDGEGRWWWVLGQASDFVGQSGQPSISAGHLGWAPALVDVEDGLIAEGDEVVTVEDEPTQGDNNRGLVDQELFYSAFDAAAVVENGGTSWSATAELFLKTAVDVAPGAYQSVLTISLIEDVY